MQKIIFFKATFFTSSLYSTGQKSDCFPGFVAILILLMEVVNAQIFPEIPDMSIEVQYTFFFFF